MNKLIMVKGLPGSGKTTWAQQYIAKHPNTVIICKDDIRAMLYNTNKRKGWHEKLVLSIRDAAIVQALVIDKSVISADTNLNPIHEDQLKRIAFACEAEFEIHDMTDVPLYTCLERNLQREDSVPVKHIYQMYQDFIRPSLTVEQDPNLPQAVICDLDSTLCLLNGRDPYNAKDCEYDLLNKPVWLAVQKYMKDGYKLIISSGRSSEYLEQTDRWLKKHGIQPDLFMMRKEGDERSDYTVKREMFMQNIKDNYYVEVAFDDRNRVVDAWRDLGITTFQVADGHF